MKPLWIVPVCAYVVVFYGLARATWRKGHHVLLGVGVVFPVLWIFGAVAAPTTAAFERIKASVARDGDARLSFLLACFEGAGSAAENRKPICRDLDRRGIEVLEEFIFKVDAKGKVRIYDPHRTLAATFTPALTWGLFGLLAGSAGWVSLAIWGVLGAICGGLYGYLNVHSLAKTQLTRVGRGMRHDSSALAVFVRAGDADAVLSSVGSFQPTSASVAVISGNLSAEVIAGAANPVEVSRIEAGAGPPPENETTLVNMLFVRHEGRRVNWGAASAGKPASSKAARPEVAVVLEADEYGRLHVHDPKWGVRSVRKQSLVSWGAFGVLFGVVAGLTGGGGILSSIESGVAVGIVWGVFGAIAGSLFGAWAGRPISSRRLQAMNGFVPPDSSLALGWADGAQGNEAIRRWAPPKSRRLLIRLNPTPQGILLEV